MEQIWGQTVKNRVTR